MPYFAGFKLKSGWGLSSEVEVLSPPLFEDSVAKGSSLIFTPTVAIKDPLESGEYAYARFKLLAEEPDGAVVLTRPLSATIEEVKALLKLKRDETKVVFSMAVASLAEAGQLLEEVGRGADAVELDLNLTCLLSGKGIAYAIELAKELSSIVAGPLVLKLSVMGVNTVELARLVADSGAAALVLTPSVVYKLGRHFFRISTPPFLSAPLLAGVAESLADLDISVAFVTQSGGGSIFELAPVKLYDVTYVLQWLKWKGAGRGRRVPTVPLAWRPISKRLRVYARKGAGFCPYGLIRGEGFVEGCNYCGVCLELNEAGLVELAAMITL